MSGVEGCGQTSRTGPRLQGTVGKLAGFVYN